MKLDPHPYGRAYFHIPTGKVVYLIVKYSDETWSAHCRFSESLTVKEDELRLATDSERRDNENEMRIKYNSHA